jgi:hypothetical protein
MIDGLAEAIVRAISRGISFPSEFLQFLALGVMITLVVASFYHLVGII